MSKFIKVHSIYEDSPTYVNTDIISWIGSDKDCKDDCDEPDEVCRHCDFCKTYTKIRFKDGNYSLIKETLDEIYDMLKE